MNYAVVIGIDHYERKPLSAAVRDANDFKDFLLAKQLIQNTPITLKVLLSESSNQIAQNIDIDKAIFDVIQDAKRHREEINRLYFYFAGHGVGVTYDNTALCLRFWPDWFHNCISSLDYKSWFINKGVFDEILIFLDCCRDYDQLIDVKSPSPDWKTQIGSKKPRILVCNSTQYGKLSYEVGSDEKRGAFTSFLIQSLNGDADLNNRGIITFEDLKTHINSNFETFARQLGRYQKGDAFTQGDFEDKAIICTVEKLSSKHNYEIKFRRNTNISLIGIDAKLIRKDEVKDGETWYCVLEKGFSVLIDNNTKEKLFIENYSENTLSYVEF